MEDGGRKRKSKPMKSYPLLLVALFVGLNTSQLSAQGCECTNCPVPVFDNGTFQGFLDVTLDGPNDLAQCPLEEVCFEITHTWVGDLSVTLTSPGGLNYLIMADLDNDFGGCGNFNENINICIQPGTFNPLTNNTEYECNGINPCLTGVWTMPCGGVTDPVTNAQQAPNCDLDDFNQPGQPANGTWILTVNDICLQDEGFLEDWSLVFACPVDTCYSCDANGGMLNQPNVAGCFGDNALQLNINPTFDGVPPNPNTTDYIYVVSVGGTIVNFVNGPDLSGFVQGTYQVCGLSYLPGDLPFFQNYIGQPFTTLQSDLNDADLGLCAELSEDCFFAQITPAIPFTFIDSTLCEGECFTAPDGTICCDPGNCPYDLTAANGCDSTIVVSLTFNPVSVESQSLSLCEGDCLTIAGTDYCAPGNFVVVLQNQFGCDSTINLELLAIPVEALVAMPDTITCQEPSVLLDGSASVGMAYQWFDPEDALVGSDPTLDVQVAGCYTLEVSNTVDGVTCTSLTVVCVEEEIILPAATSLMGPDTVCVGEPILYEIVTDPDAINYNWTIPPGASIVDGGQDSTYIVLEFDSIGTGQICVVGENFCGLGPQSCLTVTFQDVPVSFELSAPETVCPDVLFEVVASVEDTLASYDWSLPADASIVGSSEGSVITVQWGDSELADVCLTTSNFCGESQQTCISLIRSCDNYEIPNIFTPNNDDSNDFFKVLKESGATVLDFQVYNRWGQLVYNNENGDAGWDGRFNGEPLPMDVYAYIISIQLTDGEIVVEKGEVHLVR